jgi:acyl-CoA thioester hydrolase
MKASEFPFHIQQEVVFRDIDVMGHVNNAVFVTYLETARTKYLMHFMDVDETLTALPVILGKIECTFHAPAHFGEILTVATGISRFGNKSFDMAHQIDGQDGRLVLSGKTIMIMYDYDQGQSILIPDTFKQQVNQRQGNWRYAAPD